MTMMALPSAIPFECPNCAAQYKVVRVEADITTTDREITCTDCGAPLDGRDDRFVLKYFCVGRAASPMRRRG
jgi:predicted Zn finger-like uncharacterized protein